MRCDPAAAAILFVVAPVGISDAPAGKRIGGQFLESCLLARAREVEPELDQQHAFVGQHGFESIDLVEALVEPAWFDAFFDSSFDQPFVPVAKKNADTPLGRQHAPEAPHSRTLARFIARRIDRPCDDMARIHPLVEQIHRLALAGCIDAIDENDDGKISRLAQIELCVEQVGAQGRHFVLIAHLAHLLAQLGRLEHRPLLKVAPQRLNRGERSQTCGFAAQHARAEAHQREATCRHRGHLGIAPAGFGANQQVKR